MKDKLLIIRSQLKMGHRLSFAEAVLLQHAIDVFVCQAGNCRPNSNSSTNNCREISETSTNRSREHFISLCNEFWNWSEMDLVCADDRSYELRMEWDGKVFNHPVTQALWRMYQAAPTGIPMISDRWVPVSERMPDSFGIYLAFDGKQIGVVTFSYGSFLQNRFITSPITHWMPIPPTPVVNGKIKEFIFYGASVAIGTK